MLNYIVNSGLCMGRTPLISALGLKMSLIRFAGISHAQYLCRPIHA